MYSIIILTEQILHFVYLYIVSNLTLYEPVHASYTYVLNSNQIYFTTGTHVAQVNFKIWLNQNILANENLRTIIK